MPTDWEEAYSVDNKTAITTFRKQDAPETLTPIFKPDSQYSKAGQFIRP